MKERDLSIDYMKGLLVMLMIMGHVLEFFPSERMICSLFSSYVGAGIGQAEEGRES